ncbi:MAG: hypothetical protein OXU61_00430 [Gammaproteobacteria bacterium]|nr:hypothetical protein [Gammaproteobacteria bacterium]
MCYGPSFAIGSATVSRPCRRATRNRAAGSLTRSRRSRPWEGEGASRIAEIRVYMERF